jgi:hypothetical protein
MSFQVKTTTISFAAALSLAFLISLSDGFRRADDFLVAFGMIGFFGGLLEVVVGLALLFMEDKKYAQGLLLSGGLLVVIGFATCTAGMSGMSFH